jgi:radical SAM superfamily enzyme YgiQ (UPF0313 family)
VEISSETNIDLYNQFFFVELKNKIKLTLIHPSIGRSPGKKYLRAWQMEPLPMAQLAAVTPTNVEISFWDDRMEQIPYNIPADLVAISVETYTAQRAYQIASEFRKRNIPVVMGGFHATLCPEEVSQYAESVLIGQAESIWATMIEDFALGKMKKIYKADNYILEKDIIPDRSIYKGKNYLKLTLLEAGRGCKFRCEFCAIQKFFEGKHYHRKIQTVIDEVNQLTYRKQLFFFVDDNITANQTHASELFQALIPLKIKWVGQADITIANNPELLEMMVQSGCQGVLIGFESLNSENLKKMNKSFNQVKDGMENAIRKIHKAGLRLYATFLFGYDNDTINDFETTLKFCIRNKLFMVAFNHLTPFPGTDLYQRLEKDNLLFYNKWWLDKNYSYGQIPFKTALHPETIENECRKKRKKFYSFWSILYRMTNLTNISNLKMLFYYWTINLLLRSDTSQRARFPLGDTTFEGELLKVRQIR